jgi:DNA-binding NarL/FixJ family response regulator
VTRVLIVDDQAMIRVGIRAILESQDDLAVVGEADNGRTGVDRYRSRARTSC